MEDDGCRIDEETGLLEMPRSFLEWYDSEDLQEPLDDQNSDSDKEQVSATERFREHAKNESSYWRKFAVKSFPDIINAANEEEIDDLLSYVTIFSKDIEVYIKIELYEVIGLIIDALIPRFDNIDSVVESKILPSIIGNLTDSNSQVRKICQETMLSFIEKKIITKSYVENIWHVIYEMTDENMHDEMRCDSVYILIKIAQVLGPEFTEVNILPRYFELFDDPFFNVKKICAMNFGEICSVLNRADQEMLDKFSKLSEDVVWGVRKACAEAIPQISKYCTIHDRYNSLTQTYCKLLEDSSRWVRIAAYQQLGYFIATFPSVNDSVNTNSTACPTTLTNQTDNADPNHESADKPSTDAAPTTPNSEVEESFIPGRRSRTVSNSYDVSSSERFTIKVDNSSSSTEFSSSNYWRVPLPELDLELEMEEGRPKSINITSRVVDAQKNKVYKSAINLDIESEGRKVIATQSQSSEVLHFHSLKTHPSSEHLNETIASTTEQYLQQSTVQEIVPKKLFNYYLRMAEPEVAALDVDMPRHCAFCFPAVLYTLGPDSWQCLKSLYECLSRDLQWKVRRTLAFSFHEIASILGPNVTSSDLLIYFNEFVHDVDEVKTGIVANLGKLWLALDIDLSVLVLEQLSELNQLENDRNWRYRLQFTEQLNELTRMLANNQIKTFICPLAWSLLSDKVADVRREVCSLVANILKKYSETNFYELDNFVHTLTRDYGQSAIWYKRQIFLNICVIIAETHALSLELFSKHLLPLFLKIAAEDPVANVRLVAARGLSRVFIVKEYFIIDNCLYNSLEAVRQALRQSDHDRDVRQSANTEEELIAEEAVEKVDLLNF